MYEAENSVDRRSDPALRHYLTSIGRYDLLTKEEEVELTRRIRRGDGEAIDRMVNSNLRFVVSIARQYMDRGLSLLDLIAEGNLGLITAARRFDERRDFRFVTYAVWWIRQGIRTALQDQTRTVRLPANRQRQTSGLHRTVRAIEQQKMRSAREEEVAEALDLQPRVLARIRAAAAPTVDLNATSGDDSPALAETLPDTNAESALDGLNRNLLSRELDDALTELTSRERGVLRAYFGIDSGEPESLESIGRQLDLSRERVRQIRNAAFAKIRRGSCSERLVQYLVN